MTVAIEILGFYQKNKSLLNIVEIQRNRKELAPEDKM